MSKKIKFALHSQVMDSAKLPQPAKHYLPKWYKDMDLTGYNEYDLKSYTKVTAKGCVPFRDAMISGYTFELWTEIEVLKDGNDIIHFSWGQIELDALIDVRTNPELRDIPTKEGYTPPVFSIWQPLYIKTPPGYSILICPPINQLDSPLEVMSGIVDTDKHPMYPGRVPFSISSNFNGIIKVGTPLFQIIPFKRESWNMDNDKSIIEEGDRSLKKFRAYIFGGYRNMGWSKKDFN